METGAKVLIGVVTLIVLLFVSWIMIIFVGFHFEIGNGNHRGVVTAIDTSGIIFKTTKVYFKSSKEATQEDIYCMPTEKVKDLKEFLNTGEQISIEYESYVSNGIANCDVGLSDVIINFKK